MDNGLWKKIGLVLIVCLWPVSVSAANAVCFNEACFTVEVANEPQEQQRGLMFRDFMPQDHGMLFIFDHEDRYGFWMKNTLIPLDIIWLDGNLIVVHMEENVPPCEKDPCTSYRPSAAAWYVLELNAGTAKRLDLKIGDEMHFGKMDR